MVQFITWAQSKWQVEQVCKAIPCNKAGARKVAEAFYDSITEGNEYVEYGIKKCEEQKKQKEITFLKKLAKKLDMQLTEIQKCA